MSSLETIDICQTGRSLPCFQSHKRVWALKIERIEKTHHGLMKLIVEEPFAPIRQTQDWVDNRKAEAGGYWVRYGDGYESYSPAKAFEEGYTRVE